MKPQLTGMVFALLMTIGAASLFGQDDRRRGPSASDREAMYKRMDANGDGKLSPDEVSERARPYIRRAAEQAGLNPDEPLSISKLAASRDDDRGERDDENNSDRDRSSRSDSRDDRRSDDRGRDRDRSNDRDRDSRRDRDDDRRSSERDSRERKSSDKDAPLVPGFGVEDETPQAPGFDVPLETPVSGSTSSKSTESGPEVSDKIRRYAQSLVRQYDRNNNGRLEKSEWERMRGDPEKADYNRDGVVTLDELSKRLASYTQRSSSWSGSSSSDSSSSSSSRKDREPQKIYRASSPYDSLPKGLPSWFADRDADRDGQVTMSEFSSSWSDSKAREFVGYDLNNDGVVTPDECLASKK
jgi:hypothetical protein